MAADWDARRPDSNLQATIFEPAKMRMHVSINRVPATAGPYVVLDLATLFAAPPSPIIDCPPFPVTQPRAGPTP